MTMIPPTAGVQVGAAAGGGLLDTFKGMIGGAGAAGGSPAQAAPKDDGSVGLFDGVLKKTLIGGAAGAAMGFIPFIPGGPVLGGILGALGGAAMGLFGNYSKMQKIKQENAAMLAAMGVQTTDPQVQQALLSGDAQSLMALQQQAMAGQGGAGVVQQGAGVVQQGAGVVQQGAGTGVVQQGAGTTPAQLGAPGQVSQAEAQVVQQAQQQATAAATPAVGGITYSYGGGPLMPNDLGSVAGDIEGATNPDPVTSPDPVMPEDLGAVAEEAEGASTAEAKLANAAAPPAVTPGVSTTTPPPATTQTAAQLQTQLAHMQREVEALRQILKRMDAQQDQVAETTTRIAA